MTNMKPANKKTTTKKATASKTPGSNKGAGSKKVTKKKTKRILTKKVQAKRAAMKKKTASKKKATRKKTPVKKKVATKKKTTAKKKTARKKKPITPKALIGQLLPGPGQPTKYHEDINYPVYKLCLLGLTDAQLAEFLGISESTLNNWKNEHPKFLESIRAGKELADGEVVVKLMERALGYTHEEEKVFCHQGEITTHTVTKQYPPDTAAALAWLRARQPDVWIQKQELDIHHSRPLKEMSVPELRELSKRLDRERLLLTGE